MFEPLAGRLGEAERFVFVTGAGMSRESGIPTFRGKEGLWRNHDPARLATIDAFLEDPALVWEWYHSRRRNILTAEPNAGHGAIATLERHRRVAVLTQNIDGLHQRAGSTRVLELHGNIVSVRCTECGFSDGAGANLAGLPPRCGCGGVLRPDVVWFGEPLPQDVWAAAAVEAGSCDVMVVVGTSLVVSPANTLPLHARQNGSLLIEINPEETVMSQEMDLSVRGTAASVLPELLRLVSGQAAGGKDRRR